LITKKDRGSSMANYIYINLDTTAPQNPTLLIEGGAVYSTSQLVNLTITIDDANTTGYQMKIWGSVDTAYDASIQTTEAESSWITYSTNPQVQLSAGDGTKSISIRVRDDVHNASSIASDTISLDMTLPTVTVTNPDVDKISKVSGKDTFSFTFSSDVDFTEYKVKLVGSTGAAENTGTTIPTAGGSTNTSGTAGYLSTDVTTVTIKGLDLETAGATTDGQKIVKVFVKDSAGNWSV
jgi:hypothetical protein